RETAAPAIHGVLASGKGHVEPAFTTAFFPDGKADQFQPFQRTIGEVQFGIGHFARRIAPVIWRNLDDHGLLLSRDWPVGRGERPLFRRLSSTSSERSIQARCRADRFKGDVVSYRDAGICRAGERKAAAAP